mgnify:CR=1 FL=1
MGGLIKTAIERPVAILALVMLTVLFGIVALRNIPIQMSPDIEKPILEVRVNWPGASPEDVDREIVARLERELASLNGLEEMASWSSRGRARVTLTYNVSRDMDKALVLLLSKLSSVSNLPNDAKTPEQYRALLRAQFGEERLHEAIRQYSPSDDFPLTLASAEEVEAALGRISNDLWYHMGSWVMAASTPCRRPC